MVHALQELLQIKSVKSDPEPNAPFGAGINNALEYALKVGEALGFKTKNIDGYAGYIEFGSGKEMLGILCHLDVVPEGDQWTHPPYDAVISDGKLYGRGAYDDKGPAIASLFAMKALKDAGYQPNKRVRLILGTDEESGSHCMAYYLKHEEVPSVGFSPDADFPVIHGEMGILGVTLTSDFTDRLPDGGIRVLRVTGGKAPNMVPDYAEALLEETTPIEDIVRAFSASRDATITYEREEGNRVRLRAYGKSAHGSTPSQGINAIAHLISLLDLIDIEIGDQSGFIRFIANKIGTETDGRSLGIASEDAFNALVLNMGLIDIDEQHGSVTLNIRYPITEKEKKFKTAIDSAVRGTVLHIDQWRNAPPLFFKTDHPLVKTLMRVYAEKTGDTTAKPITIGGGTYARAIPNAVAFGALFPGAEDTMHQKDEYIALDDLFKISEIYEAAIRALTE
jgi:succinyl-diaminopimelate desuccinylase